VPPAIPTWTRSIAFIVNILDENRKRARSTAAFFGTLFPSYSRSSIYAPPLADKLYPSSADVITFISCASPALLAVDLPRRARGIRLFPALSDHLPVDSRQRTRRPRGPSAITLLQAIFCSLDRRLRKFPLEAIDVVIGSADAE